MLRARPWRLLPMLTLLFAACAGNPSPTPAPAPGADGAAEAEAEVSGPPSAKELAAERQIHGRTLVDPYAWLRDKENPEVIAYLEAENRYTEAETAHTETLREELYEEMVGRIKETDLSVPIRKGDYHYYSRTEKGKQYQIYARKKGSLEAPEEVLLDLNELAEGHDYFSLGGFAVSPDHRLLAYSFDTDGSEIYTMRVKDLESGELLADVIPGISFGIEWGNDNRTLFYTTRDEASRPYKLFRHRLGGDPAADELIHHEEDESFFLGIDKTRSERYVLLGLASSTTTEIWVLDADRPGGTFRLVAPRRHEVEYSLAHHGDHFYLLTNEGAKNFKLMRTPVDDTDPERWQEVIPHRDEVKLESVETFADHLVVRRREDGLRKLRIYDLAANDLEGGAHDISFPEPVYTVFPTGNAEFDSDVLRFRYASMVTPPSVFDYDMSERTRELRKQDEIGGGYDPADFASERIFARAEDGTRIPISLVYKKGIERDGTSPLLLYAYGSYGASSEPSFSTTRLSLLERGVIYAIAHIRGGGEMGEVWHDQGKLLNKKNTFTDFIAAAEHLIDAGYTTSDRLGIFGGSAGGLLVGAVVNMRPDLFAAAVAAVPFVDVINTMLDPSIPLTVIEYEEWGNPNEPEYFDYMLSYSPYDNVRPQEYPDLLITAGLNDPRVGYWEPAKWTAKLRATKQGNGQVLLKTNMGAGHSGVSGRYNALKETAFYWAFILDALGAGA